MLTGDILKGMFLLSSSLCSELWSPRRKIFSGDLHGCGNLYGVTHELHTVHSHLFTAKI
jgi:hypothetical protein